MRGSLAAPTTLSASLYTAAPLYYVDAGIAREDMEIERILKHGL